MALIIEHLSDLANETPMMAQYREVKNRYKDYILLYRLGDFYEMFFEDALTASRVLELTLTGRDCGNGCRAAMCGVPFHKVDEYIGRLVEKGYKAAICEQTEDPAVATGLVKRGVIRVVTPGTVTDDVVLESNCNNYLAAICLSGALPAVAFADISTGQVYATVATSREEAMRQLETELGTYAPKEAILDLPAAACRDLCDFLTLRCASMITDGRPDLFDPAAAAKDARACFGEEAEKRLSDPSVLMATGAVLAYIRETQMVDPTFMRELHIYVGGQYVELDLSTLRNLELTESMRDRDKHGTLLWVLDRTATSMGARALRSWIRQPLRDVAAIRARQSGVSELYADFLRREELRDALSGILDIERLTAKAVYGSANARDLRSLCESIKPLPDIRALLANASSRTLKQICDGIDPMKDLCELLDRALVDAPPLTVREGEMIREGYSEDVDKLRSVKDNGQAWMKQIEAQEIERTGIRNLRVGYNRVFGYYIEVTKSQVDQVPDTYIRKQTLTGCERYITQELKEMEATVLGAGDRLCALEYELFSELRRHVTDAAARLQQTAAQLAALDVLCSFAEVSAKNNYVCPEVDMSEIIEIKDGRHPVVEKFMTDTYFVPNDTQLDTGAHRMMLITGPNMAGKSTYMRQVALIVLMAQIGSFVPASEARIGVVDRVFTRVGASDDLASGQSTFMLEMNEVANILRFATRRSLVVYDEVGRGTSTYDGMSIARAVVEYTASRKIGARCMFATHYHELTAMEGEYEGVVNFHVAAKKRGDDIVFLRKIVRGATDDSYGIEVAKLAGVPAEVVRRAREVLREIEGEAPAARKATRSAQTDETEMPDMLAQLRTTEAEEVAEALRRADLNTLTPLEAMNLLFALKKKLTAE